MSRITLLGALIGLCVAPLTQAAPALSAPFYDRTADRFSVTVQEGQGTTLEASTDLEDWSVLAADFSGTFDDPDSASLPWRYYRLTQDGNVLGSPAGYIRVNAAATGDFLFLGNPFLHSGSLEESLVPPEIWFPPVGQAQDGMILFAWVEEQQQFQAYLHDLGEWAPSLPQLAPSHGVILQVPGPLRAVFTGFVPPRVEHSHPAGLSLNGLVLKPGSPEEALGIPTIEGVVIYAWDQETQQYQTSLCDFGEWQPAITLEPGQAWWLHLPEPAAWTQPISADAAN